MNADLFSSNHNSRYSRQSPLNRRSMVSPFSVADLPVEDVVFEKSPYILALQRQYERPDTRVEDIRRCLRIKKIDETSKNLIKTPEVFQPTLKSKKAFRDNVHKELQHVVRTKSGDLQDVVFPPSQCASSTSSSTQNEPAQLTPSKIVSRPRRLSRAAAAIQLKSPPPRKYRRQPVLKCWEFGRPKALEPLIVNRKTTKAATTIQCWLRRWWQQLQYKYQLSTYKIENRDLLTRRALQGIRDDLELRKNAFLKEAREEAQVKTLAHDEMLLKEHKKIEEFLRSEHTNLVKENQELATAIENLKRHNMHLEDANVTSYQNIHMLEEKFKEIQMAHKHLCGVEPKYRQNVLEFQKALDERQDYCVSEHRIRLHYAKLLEDVLSRVKESPDEHGLVIEVLDLALELETTINVPDVPPFMKSFRMTQ